MSELKTEPFERSGQCSPDLEDQSQPQAHYMTQPQSQQQPITARQPPLSSKRYQSISEFTQDQQFVEFLKKIQIYITSESSPSKSARLFTTSSSVAVSTTGDNENKLFTNLKIIREQYKDFLNQKQDKATTQNFNQKGYFDRIRYSDNSVQQHFV